MLFLLCYISDKMDEEKYKKAVLKQLYEECNLEIEITNDYILKSYLNRLDKYMKYADAVVPNGMSAKEYMES